MKVSVVIPIHNSAAYLRECLDSVLAQSFTDFELILVDDASTDRSAEIIASYEDQRIRRIALPRNLGPGRAAQAGHDIATGEYIIRADSDDVQDPERFAVQVAFMDADPAVGASGTYLELLGGGGIRQRPLTDAACKAQLLFGVAMFQPSMIFRRKLLVDHGLHYSPEWPFYGEDRLLQLRLAEKMEFANVPEALVKYREGGISSRRDRTADLYYLATEVFRWYGLPDPSEEELYMHCMVNRHFPRPPSPQHIVAFKAWLEGLAEWNKKEQVFDRAAFHERLDEAWHGLFHHLPEYGWGVVKSYLKAGGRLGVKRLYYLVRTLGR